MPKNLIAQAVKDLENASECLSQAYARFIGPCADKEILRETKHVVEEAAEILVDLETEPTR